MATSGSYKYTIATNLDLYVSWTTSYSFVDPSCFVTVTQKAYLKYTGSFTGNNLYSSLEMSEEQSTLNPMGTISGTSATEAKYLLATQSHTYQMSSSASKVFSPLTIPHLAARLNTTGSGGIIFNGMPYEVPTGGWIASASNVVIDGRNYNPPTLTLSASEIGQTNASFTATNTDGRDCYMWNLYIDGNLRKYSSVIGPSYVFTGGDIALSPNTTYTACVTALTYPEGVSATSSEITFTTVSQDPPVVSVATGTIAADFFELFVSTDVSCQEWKYTIDGVERTWGSGSGTSTTMTIGNLSPNTTYQVSASAKSTVNGVVGTSQTISVTTTAKTLFTTRAYSYSLDNSLSSITINVQRALILGGSLTCYHDLMLTSSTLQSRQLLDKQTLSNGANTVALSSADISWIDGIIGVSGSVTFDLVLMSYSNASGTTFYGSDTASITFSKSAPEAPTFTNFTYADTNSTTTAITGNNQILIKGYSNLVVTATAATPHGTGVTITSYSAVFGENSGQSTTRSINLGTVKRAGTANITTTATDSNGLTASVSKSATSLNYEKLSMSGLTVSRSQTATDNHVYATVSGKFYSLVVSNTEKNALQTLTYQYRRSDSLTWSNAADILSSAVVSGTEDGWKLFSVTNVQLAELSRDYSWYIRITATDKLSTYTIDGSILGDVPLMSYRAGKVGINNKNPNAALDVIGNIEMNGFNVQGFVRALGSGDDLNTILATGIYTADPNGSYSGLNYPTTDKGVLEVIPETGGYVQRFTKVPVDGKVWIRHYTTSTTSFGNWFQLSGSGAFTQQQSDFAETDDTKVTYIKNKPVVDSVLTPDGVNAVEGGAIYEAIQNAKADGSIFYVKGSGSVPGSTTSATRTTAVWHGDNSNIDELYDGLTINYKIEIAGQGSYGTALRLNDFDNENIVLANVSTAITTRYAVGCIITLTFDADVDGTMYVACAKNSLGTSTTDPTTDGATLAGHETWSKGDAVTYASKKYVLVRHENIGANWVQASSTTTTYVTYTCHGCWKIADYDSNSNTVPSIQLDTAAATAAKVGTCTYFVLADKHYAHVNVRYANTVANTITLNTNSTGAMVVYINGTRTSTTNNTLPAGTYIVYIEELDITFDEYSTSQTYNPGDYCKVTKSGVATKYICITQTTGTFTAANWMTIGGSFVYHFRTDGKLPGRILRADAADSVPWSGITARPTVSYVSIDNSDPTQLNIIDI